MTQEMLALSGRYSPTIMYGRQFIGRQVDESGVGYRSRFRSRHYSLVAVHRGSHLLEPPDGTRLRIGQGGCYLVPPGPHHFYTASHRSDASQLSFTLMAQDLHHAGASLVQTDKSVRQPQPVEVWGVDLPLKLHPSLGDRIGHDLRTICALWWRDRRSHVVANAMLVGVLTAIASCYWELADPHDGHGRLREGSNILLRAMTLFEEEMIDIPNVEVWARRLELSRAYFTRWFRRQLGQAPGSWMRTKRIQQAERLLYTGTVPLADIAHRCGYGSLDAFRRAFRRYHGASCEEWVARHRR